MTDLLLKQPERALTAKQFQQLADVPPELEWFANISAEKTRKAYQNDIHDFTQFVGIQAPAEFRIVTRSHVIAWRKSLEAKTFSDASIRRKLSALSSLFEYLCEHNAATGPSWPPCSTMACAGRNCAICGSKITSAVVA